jgi:hypothetical protein
MMNNAPQHKPPDGYEKLDYGNGLHGFTFGNAMISYLPPIYASHIQPLDQGIIGAVKQRYRNSLLDRTLNEMEHYDCNLDGGNYMHYSRESLPWLKRNWVDVPDSVFANFFRRVRILSLDAPYQRGISSWHDIDVERANRNPQSNSEESLATLNEVCEKTTPAEKVEQIQERLNQLTVLVPEPLMRFNEADAENHEKAVIEQRERQHDRCSKVKRKGGR